MHGNPHASSDHELNDSSATLGAAIWLGLPAAREYFDASALSESDYSRFIARRGERRRADFEVSRSLLTFANVGTAAYSLSHSAEHAALLVAPTGRPCDPRSAAAGIPRETRCRTGVDLEIDRPRDVLRLARFAFHEREVVALEAAPEEARSQLFYTLWTLKESFAKALQLDLIDALRQCVFWNEAGAWHGEVPTKEAWSATVFQPRPHLCLAAACIGARETPPFQQWEWPPKQRGDWPVIACACAPAAADAVQA